MSKSSLCGEIMSKVAPLLLALLLTVACDLLATPAWGDDSTVLYPPGCSDCSTTCQSEPRFCSRVYTEEQKQTECRKYPMFVGCEDYRECSLDHLLSLLQQQAELIERREEQKPGYICREMIPISEKGSTLPIIAEIQESGEQRTLRKRQKAMTEEVQKVLRECGK